MTDTFVKLEPLETVNIDNHDAANLLDFWQHFDLEMPLFLKNAVADFTEKPTVENQNTLRLAICKAIMEGKEPIFNDEVFLKIKNNAQKILFHNYFNKELESILDNKVD